GESCNNGVCECPFGTIECGGGCRTASVDPLNCGSCGNVCGVGQNVGKPYCVSNGCVADCPAPLSKCPTGGVGGLPVCTNTDSDSRNCGGCGNICPEGQGCAAGQCRPVFPLG